MSDATVLVVDDDEFIRDLTSSALRIAGFVTTMASGGLEHHDVGGNRAPWR
jgi:CheY-like chemotaxis protein